MKLKNNYGLPLMVHLRRKINIVIQEHRKSRLLVTKVSKIGKREMVGEGSDKEEEEEKGGRQRTSKRGVQ